MARDARRIPRQASVALEEQPPMTIPNMRKVLIIAMPAAAIAALAITTASAYAANTSRPTERQLMASPVWWLASLG
jgi:hypothetical protein